MWYVILRRRRRTEEEEDEEEEADSRLLQRPDVRAEGSTLPRAHLELRVTHPARHASGGVQRRVISAYATAGDTAGAERYLAKIEERGVPPRLHSYNFVFSAYAAAGSSGWW